jgi:hypothetical protein
VDDAGVRALIATLTNPDGSSFAADSEVNDVLIQDGWLAIVLGVDHVPRERLARLHALLHEAYPGVEVEIRSGGRVFRGGYGLGTRRHVIAVLGGKGGVGKSTVAVNLSLTLASASASSTATSTARTFPTSSACIPKRSARARIGDYLQSGSRNCAANPTSAGAWK